MTTTDTLNLEYFNSIPSYGVAYPVTNQAKYNLKFKFPAELAKAVGVSIRAKYPELHSLCVSYVCKNGFVLVGGQFGSTSKAKDIFYLAIASVKKPAS